MDKVQLFQLSNYVRPEIKEDWGRKWVLNGKDNSFFRYIIDRKEGSPTNESVLNVYSQLLFGRGVRIVGQEDIYEELIEIFPKRELRKCLDDYKVFGMYAMQILRAKGGGVAMIKHLPIDKVGFEKMDDNGDINNIYYCEDWKNTTKYKPELYPIFKGKMTESVMVKVVAPYCAGKYYYSNPDYLAALQYAQIEEEISNFSINHILNGLSFGYIINVNNGGALTDEQKDELERKITEKVTGSSNAGKFILSFNDGKDAEVTIYPLEVNDAHNQWESLREEAKQQILTCHGVTSPLLFGLPSAGGFGSNADELDTASKLLQDYQITPKQERFIDELANILELAGLETDLEFIPLRDSYKSTEETQQQVQDDTVDEEQDTQNANDAEVKMSSQEPKGFEMSKVRNDDNTLKKVYFVSKEPILKDKSRDKIKDVYIFSTEEQGTYSAYLNINNLASNEDYTNYSFTDLMMKGYDGIDLNGDYLVFDVDQIHIVERTKKDSSEVAMELIQLGEDINENWEIIDERRCDEITIKEDQLNTVFQFAQVPVTPRKNSEQDTSLFKIRYKYAGLEPKEDSREFCKKVWKANKYYRAEDLNFNANYNEDFAPSGDDSYNIFKYKGGVNCKHFWQRVIFLKKSNKQISVNDARKMILALEPEDRKDVRWEQNDKRVAQIASVENDWWSKTKSYINARRKNLGLPPK